ncbi:MAG: hypothetical protein GWO10_29475 [candidate division Zixibacteria bacterium]|nr:hypothetical protein [candidate division Zixibacteria bacterium]
MISGNLALENIWTRLIFFPDASAVKHTGYFSDDYSDVAGRVQDANLGEPPYEHISGWEYTFFAGNPQVPPADETLVRGAKYYWTVDETDALGNTLAGDVWEFIIQDFKASFFNPPNEAIFVETDVLLSWVPGFGVEEHDVYLGTDLDSVELAEYDSSFPPPEYVGTTQEPNIFVTGLASDTKYYWRVDEVSGRLPHPFNGGTIHKSDVWGFTTVPEGVGTIREDLWWNIAGDDVSDLLNDPRYPGNPDEIRILTSFNSGVALGNDYGGQIHGWLHPVKSGNYTFWLCSDDSSELFLSTDHTPANKVRIAYINGWANPFDWYNQSGTNNPNQQSAPISLVGGRKYYIMARWKEDFAGDHCMVAWQGPDQPQAPVYGSSFAVIKGNRLSPYAQLSAHDPVPSDGQVNVVSPVTLRWGSGDNAAEHDVYVGTDKALVENRAPSVYKGRVDSNFYNLGTVLSGMIYYWAIDEVSYSGPSPGIWQGDVWSFTTKPAPIFVDDDAIGANDGSNWADAYNSLQDGLARADSSVKPVEIRVAQGVYKPTSYAPPPPGAPPSPVARAATFQLINGVTIKGGYAGFGEADPNTRDIEAYETILSGDLANNDIEVIDPCDLLNELSRGENSYHVVTGSGTDETAVLDGFTITGGNANEWGGQNSCGGGMFNEDSNPKLINCIFSQNSASYGGAIYNDSSSPMTTNCTFKGNSAKKGGGMCNDHSSPTVTNCTFNENSSKGSGGGMGNYYSRPTLTNCTFADNTTHNGSDFISGGGMINFRSSPTLTNCTFSGNSSRYRGGGMFNQHHSAPNLTNCIFSGNSVENRGGAMCNELSSPTVTDCTFSRNSAENGGGMYNHKGNPALADCIFSGNSAAHHGGAIYSGKNSNPMLTNCTFVANSALHGEALACHSYEQEYPSNLELTNCILWDGGNEIWNNDGSIITVTYSNVQGGWSGESNIDADPCFVQAGYWDANGMWIGGDYHLQPGSPCIDAGDPCYMPEPNETDLDGRPRVIGGRIDMGAYEFFNTPPVADGGDDQVVECACNTAEGTRITLDGSGSYDVDGDALTYRWTGPFIESPADEVGPTVTLEDGCPGEYVITLVVNDGTEDSEPNEVVITVVDTTPPEFTFSVSPTMLWPPNKKMVKITPSWTVSDNCDATPDVSLVSVSMNESETRGNAHTGDDIQIDQDGTIYVRAKRNRKGDRIYTITYQAVDNSGNATVRSATVTVPRKRR